MLSPLLPDVVWGMLGHLSCYLSFNCADFHLSAGGPKVEEEEEEPEPPEPFEWTED